MEARPAFKYSREANEKKPAAAAHHHHHHEHGHGHDDHDHGHGHHHHHHEAAEAPSHKYSKEANERASQHAEEPKKKPPPPQQRDKWTIVAHATVSTLLISIAPFFILFFIPLNNNRVENQSLLNVLLAFASGSLLGDAFLHLIPHALHPHDHSSPDEHHHEHAHAPHDHSAHTMVGLWILAGILVFLLVEKAVRSVNGGASSHTHSHGGSQPAVDSSTAAKKKNDAPTADKDKEKEKKGKSAPVAVAEEQIQVAGYLNLAADFAHNFTDGLAIGASFLAGQNIGIITTLTILFHEIPHEIGDFAILIQSGCSKKKVIIIHYNVNKRQNYIRGWSIINETFLYA